MKRLIAFVMMIAVCMSLLIFPALADDDYPEVGFDFEAFEAQEKIDGQPNMARWKYTSSTSLQNHTNSYSCSLQYFLAFSKNFLSSSLLSCLSQSKQ